METGCRFGGLLTDFVDVDTGWSSVSEQDLAVGSNHVDRADAGRERDVPG